VIGVPAISINSIGREGRAAHAYRGKLILLRGRTGEAEELLQGVIGSFRTEEGKRGSLKNFI